MRHNLRPVPGSTRAAVLSAGPSGPVDPTTMLTVTVVLRRRALLPDSVVHGSHYLSPTELGARYGASETDIEVVRSVLTAAGLTVGAVDATSRRLEVTGPALAFQAAFGVTLTATSSPNLVTGAMVDHRQRVGEITIPADLDGIVIAVLGLDDRPQARAHFRVASSSTRDAAGTAAATSYSVPQLAQAYAFPAGTDGAGQTLAIVELGGGFGPGDLDTYFGGLAMATPAVTAVGVDGASNVAGQDPQGADGEVLLDIEVAGALAPAAAIAVYFAPNTDRGFLDAVSTAIHATPTPSALSISWGQSEDSWTGQARTALDQAFMDAAALGVTVCVAAGDNGSTDGATANALHVDFPASSPHVLACGGTTLKTDATGGALSETVWNDGPRGGATGGGVSDTFAAPAWQSGAGVPSRPGGGPGRGVPDVAGDADPATGYQVVVDGQHLVIGGTSAVAPLWAALVCRLSQGAGRPLGLLQPALYAGASTGHSPQGFRDITDGTNGAYNAGPGWDACTGLGVPHGEHLLAALTGR